ncbi:MAG: HlyD family efflux transporter periplasmic adaptor subunit [Aquificae bacterium]|nr:HlyD family efflux transporter periplasmic adaptor subunit [Aquificota bacterium]
MQKKLGALIIILLIVLFAIFAFRWVKHRIEYAVTNAVFVESDYISNIGFHRVSGKITHMYKKEGDIVKTGEPLAKLYDKDYKVELKSTQDKIKALTYKKQALEEKINRIKKELDINQEVAFLGLQEINQKIEEFKYNITQLEIQLAQLKKDRDRLKRLLEKKLIPSKSYEEVQTQYQVLTEKKQQLEKTLAQLQTVKQKAEKNLSLAKVKKEILKELKKELKAVDSQLKALEKQKEDIENKLTYTLLTAPFDGYIGKKFVSVGDSIKAGMPVYSIIKKDSFYINVLLEENKLKGIKIGSKAKIKLDAYPDEEFEGEVEVINYATAAKYALVPRDISAGEFTKVVQRVPVKIRITKGKKELLRVGLGGEVEIKRED